MASLAEEIKTFKKAGFSEAEVESFKQEEIKLKQDFNLTKY